MGQPVVHFEIIGGNPAELRTYYAELFGWTLRENSPVPPEVSRTDSYSFIDRMTTDDGTGIPGGVGRRERRSTAVIRPSNTAAER
jgi:uncharacterized protein